MTLDDLILELTKLKDRGVPGDTVVRTEFGSSGVSLWGGDDIEKVKAITCEDINFRYVCLVTRPE